MVIFQFKGLISIISKPLSISIARVHSFNQEGETVSTNAYDYLVKKGQKIRAWVDLPPQSES